MIMVLKKFCAILCLGGLCAAGIQLTMTTWSPSIFISHMIAGVIALLLYDGKNFLSGPWDLAKTSILAVVMFFGYFCLLLYAFTPPNENTPNRS